MSTINEKGQIENEKGNILCRKLNTRKEQYLSKLIVNNSEAMARTGWEPVMQPELPPSVKSNSSFSAASYGLPQSTEKFIPNSTDAPPSYPVPSQPGVNKPEPKPEPELTNGKKEVTEQPVEVTEKKKRGRKPGTVIKKESKTK